MKLTENELLEYKKNIDDSKTKIAELKGQQKMILKQLKESFDCSTIKEAEEKIAEYEKTIDILCKRIKKETERLEEKLTLTNNDNEGD